MGKRFYNKKLGFWGVCMWLFILYAPLFALFTPTMTRGLIIPFEKEAGYTKDYTNSLVFMIAVSPFVGLAVSFLLSKLGKSKAWQFLVGVAVFLLLDWLSVSLLLFYLSH